VESRVTFSKLEAPTCDRSNRKLVLLAHTTPAALSSLTNREQVVRAIDALTLHITDFKFSILLPDQRSLRMGGNDLQLVALEKQTDGKLRQELSLGRLYSTILSCAIEYPLLDSIRYSATCTRILDDGVGSTRGLQVVGKSTDEGIVIHAGIDQIKLLNDFGGMLVSQSPTLEPGDYQNVILEEEAAATVVGDDGDNQRDLSPSSYYLPLAGVSLVFPNQTMVSLSGLSATYSSDGSQLQIRGNKGFLIDGFPFLALGDGCYWCVDLVNSKFSVERADSDGDTVAGFDQVLTRFQARDEELQKVLAGLAPILDLYKASQDQGALASLTKRSMSTQTAHKTADENIKVIQQREVTYKWTAEVNGTVLMSWRGAHDEVDVSMKGIFSKLSPTMSTSIHEIDRIFAAERFTLAEPMNDTKISFDGKILHFNLDNVKGQLLKAKEGKTTNTTNGVAVNMGVENKGVELPIGVKFDIKSLVLDKPVSDTKSDKRDRLVSAQNIILEIFSELSPSRGIMVKAEMDDIDHDLICLVKPCLKCSIHSNMLLDRISDFSFHADSITVETGYSPLAWARINPYEWLPKKIKQQHTSTVVYLPFAHVDKLKVHVAVEGVVGMKDAVLHFPPFDGNERTTGGDLIRHYSESVITAAPGIISNVNVLGVNVADTAVLNVGIGYGTALLHGLGGAAGPAGGVLGIAAFDGVRNLIKAGKKSRGAADDDKFVVSDLVFGIGYSAEQAAQSGAEKRGKKDCTGNVVDWTVGATADIAEYVDKKKSRLGGATAGAIAFGFGTALGGPLGGIGAAALVGTMTGMAIDKIDPQKEETNDSLSNQSGDEITTFGS
jgi:hypothetical protein